MWYGLHTTVAVLSSPDRFSMEEADVLCVAHAVQE